MPNILKNFREGEEFKNNQHLIFRIIKYKNALNVTVKFIESGGITQASYGNIITGNIKDNLYKSVYGIGFTGIGNYKCKVNGKNRINYDTWHSMLRRCYGKTELKRNPTYNGCYVCKEWHNFQNFAAWFEENYIPGNHLDKDILVKGNKIYSPDTCCFVPYQINTLFISCGKARGKYPIGVNYSKIQKRFVARLNISCKRILLGYFNNKYDAFVAYKKAKEDHIRKTADNFYLLGKITEKTYQALLNYKIEITD